MSQIPNEAPPPYDVATGGSSTGLLAPNPASSDEANRPRARSRNGISRASRRSMEDEGRPLPDGWVRQLDSTTHHQFFVDTRSKPPRSIWHHPYDDEQYLETLNPKEREHIASSERGRVHPNLANDTADDEDQHDGKSHHIATQSANGSSSNQASQERESLGERMKSKLTGTTHAEREKEREQQAQEEQHAYQVHRMVRQAMVKAQDTGEPQLIGKDKDGHDLYIEPPQSTAGDYAGRGRGYNPYTSGPYANPNARFIRPEVPYQRSYGYGYGGGLGYPLMGGGLMGPMMLGGMMGGGLGMGMGMGMGGMGMGGGFGGGGF